MDEPIEAVTVVDWTALLAYLLVGVAVILVLSFGIDVVAKRFGFTEFVEIGRRRDLGFIMALLIGLPLTRLIGKSLGLTPKRVKSR